MISEAFTESREVNHRDGETVCLMTYVAVGGGKRFCGGHTALDMGKGVEHLRPHYSLLIKTHVRQCDGQPSLVKGEKKSG